MGWLLGCFKCTGKPDGLKSKKQLSAVNDLVSGRSNSAAVAHATSPEDLYIVRKLPSSLEATNSKGHVEKEPYDSLSSPLQDQAKTKKSAKAISKQDEDKGWSHEYDLDGELESFRERLLQDANAAKHELKFLRGCHSLLESPSDAFKVTFDKSVQDPIEQVDYAQHSWRVSSLVTRIQPGGLRIEARSRPSSPLLNLCEGSSLHSRGIHASQSNSFDSFGDNNALKCAELSLFRVESGVCGACVDGIRESLQTTQNKTHCETDSRLSERNVPSPPWTFVGVKANEKSSSIDEPSDDLLLEHLDVSSLIQDSALITNWELSSGSSCTDTLRLTDEFLQISSEEETKEQANQKHSESRTDGGSLDFDLNCLPVVLKAHTKNEPGFCIHPFADEATCSSNGILIEAHAPYGRNEAIHAEEMSIGKDADHLLRAESWAAAEESDDSDSTSQSCFSSQFRLSKRAWNSTRKNLPDKESNIWDYLQQNGRKDAHEVLLPSMHPEMESLQESNRWEDEHHPLLRATSETSIFPNNNGFSHGDYTDVYVNGNASYLSLGPLEAKVVPQDSTEDFPLKDDGIKCMVSFPLEEEDGEQRKKIKFGDGGESGRLRESVLVEEDEVPLLNVAAIEDGHESSVEVRPESFGEYESTGSKHLNGEISFEQTLPSSPHVETPTSVTSYRSPASLADERPILGTVAAHWSPIATRKWWDGKGIPNSTNKYQEDQKVNWHVIPFEVRLEQALAKQK